MKQSLLDMNTQTNTSTVTVGYVTTTKARETLEFNDIEKIDLKKVSRAFHPNTAQWLSSQQSMGFCLK